MVVNSLGISSQGELNQKLQGRQARCNQAGAVFESQPVDSAADMTWGQVTATQFTPRQSDVIKPFRGKEEAPNPLVTVTASTGGTPHDRSVSPMPKPSTSASAGEAAEDMTPTVNQLPGNSANSELLDTVTELEKERERSRLLEKRAAEAEFIAVWLKEELDKSTGNCDLDGTCPVMHNIPTNPHGEHKGEAGQDDMDNTRPVMRRGSAVMTADVSASARAAADPVLTRPRLGSSIVDPVITQPKLGVGTAPMCGSNMKMTRMPSFDEDLDVSVMSDPRELREELLKSYTYIEKKNHEILNLEEQNLVLREELNHEKQKVIELKRAANTQKEESQKVNGEMEMNQWLTEEVTLLRNSVSELQEKLEQAVQREEFLKSELADTRSQTNKATDIHNEEMGRLSVTVGEQLVQVERELAQRTKELSEATEPFLKHAYGLLVAARKAVQQIESASGRPARQVPQLYDLRSRDLASSFRSILKLLKYMVEVLAQHTGMPNPFDKQGAGNEEKFSVCDSVSSLASSVQASDLGSQRSALRPPNSGCVAGSQRECGGNKARDDKGARMRSRLSSQYFPGQLQADPEDTPDKEQLQPEVEVESTSKRWMCYLQE